jgi:major membrane immunogen (membrane-anchored lipoprotein)
MRNTARYAALLVMLALALSLLSACGKSSSVADVPVEELAQKVDEAIGNDGTLIAVDADYIKGYMRMDVSDYVGFVVKINAYGANIDEYGIFKGADEKQAKEIAKAVEDYLQLREDTWMEEYMPEEKPKLLAAEYKVLGNYVMYAILWDEEKAAAFDAFTSALSK